VIDASQISGNLYQGGAPQVGHAVREAGFDALVLCAMEYQPNDFPGVKVFHAPNDDSGQPPDGFQVMVARLAAEAVVRELGAGKKVLVTCMAGRNRSGLVNGMALIKLGRPVDAVIARIRERRRNALTNEHFVALLRAFARRLQGNSALA